MLTRCRGILTNAIYPTEFKNLDDRFVLGAAATTATGCQEVARSVLVGSWGWSRSITINCRRRRLAQAGRDRARHGSIQGFAGRWVSLHDERSRRRLLRDGAQGLESRLVDPQRAVVILFPVAGHAPCAVSQFFAHRCGTCSPGGETTHSGPFRLLGVGCRGDPSARWIGHCPRDQIQVRSGTMSFARSNTMLNELCFR